MYFLKIVVADEWNASHVVRTNTKPDVILRPGVIVQPIKLTKKQRSK